MHTAISINVVDLRNRLLAQLSPSMQIWVRQQAQRIVSSRRFGRWEEMQLNEEIRQKLSQASLRAGSTLVEECGGGGAKPEMVISTLRFLTLADAIATTDKMSDNVGYNPQLANVDLQNALQKQQQALQMISAISKMSYDTAMAVIRKVGA